MENAILLCFEKPFKSAAIIFYFIGTLTRDYNKKKDFFTDVAGNGR